MKFEVVAPCKNEEQNIKKFYDTVKKELDNFDFNIKFVDDGSTDNTWNKIKEINNLDKRVSGIKLLKNYGKENAITAGLDHKINDYDFKIIIDVDLQHPIEVIPQMIKRWVKGEKVVGTYREKFQEGFIREIGSSIFYYFMKKFSDVDMLSKTTDYMLVDQVILKKYIQVTEKNKVFRATINLIYNITDPIKIIINPRKKEGSKYNFTTLLKFAVNTFTSFSIFPLKIIGYVGLFLSTASIIAIPILFALNLFQVTPISLQTIIIILLVLLNGLILISNGILAIYITKIFDNVNTRPDYIIEKKI
jgi:polyisoprenyl-phosphate glycosyltransferase